MSNNSPINLGDLNPTKPVNTFIEKMSDAVGTLYEPRRIRKAAEAEADAAIIKAQAESEITDLQQRAEHRRIVEDMRHQKHMEAIITQAIPHVDENASPKNMDDDWITNLFEKCRIVSDTEMQSLWARVLATEANTPGTLSKRTVNLLSGFDKSDAELFTKLCGFCWVIGDIVVPLVFYTDAEIYNKHGINFDALNHLETIGLIHFESGVGLPLKQPLKTMSYYGKQLNLDMPQDSNGEISMGHTRLTKNGNELAPICGSQPVDGFYEYVYEYAKKYWSLYLP